MERRVKKNDKTQLQRNGVNWRNLDLLEKNCKHSSYFEIFVPLLTYCSSSSFVLLAKFVLPRELFRPVFNVSSCFSCCNKDPKSSPYIEQTKTWILKQKFLFLDFSSRYFVNFNFALMWMLNCFCISFSFLPFGSLICAAKMQDSVLIVSWFGSSC